MTYARKVDGNQKEIVDGLRQLGYVVAIVSRVGNGIPDLVVANEHQQVWVEVKEPGKKLTEKEVEFFAVWPPKLRIIAESIDDVLRWFGRM
jgi:Holliday junction resolvase